jgi:hypothetical protein
MALTRMARKYALQPSWQSLRVVVLRHWPRRFPLRDRWPLARVLRAEAP